LLKASKLPVSSFLPEQKSYCLVRVSKKGTLVPNLTQFVRS